MTGPLAPLPDRSSSRHSRESLLPIFWRQRYVIAACAILALGAGVAYLLTATKIYTSTARMKVTPAASRLTGEVQGVSDATAGNYLYTEREVLASPSVLALTAQLPEVKTYLADDPQLPLVPPADQAKALEAVICRAGKIRGSDLNAISHRRDTGVPPVRGAWHGRDARVTRGINLP